MLRAGLRELLEGMSTPGHEVVEQKTADVTLVIQAQNVRCYRPETPAPSRSKREAIAVLGGILCSFFLLSNGLVVTKAKGQAASTRLCGGMRRLIL